MLPGDEIGEAAVPHAVGESSAVLLDWLLQEKGRHCLH